MFLFLDAINCSKLVNKARRMCTSNIWKFYSCHLDLLNSRLEFKSIQLTIFNIYWIQSNTQGNSSSVHFKFIQQTTKIFLLENVYWVWCKSYPKRNGLMRTCSMNIENLCNQHSKYISGEIWIRIKKFRLGFLFLSLSWFIKFKLEFKIA